MVVQIVIAAKNRVFPHNQQRAVVPRGLGERVHCPGSLPNSVGRAGTQNDTGTRFSCIFRTVRDPQYLLRHRKPNFKTAALNHSASFPTPVLCQIVRPSSSSSATIGHAACFSVPLRTFVRSE
jgi:hypothetical protein